MRQGGCSPQRGRFTTVVYDQRVMVADIRGPIDPGSRHIPLIAGSRRLAAELEEIAPPSEIARRLDCVARGVDFVDGAAGSVPPSWKDRMRALEMMIERQFGKMKSHVVVEGELGVKASIDARVAVFALDARDVEAALGDGLEQFRVMQAALVERAKEKVKLLTARREALLAGEDDDEE